MNDSEYIITAEFLSYPDKTWVTTNFPNLHRPAVVRFFNDLIRKGILKRNSAFGPSSRVSLIKPDLLLKLCINGFKKNESKLLNFTSKESGKEILSHLKNQEIEFYPGRLSGVRPELIYSSESTLSLLIPDRKLFWGKKLDFFQMDTGLFKVKFGGGIQIILPRFKIFLRRYAQKVRNLLLPSDFYSYLSLTASSSPMAEPQIEYMQNKLKGQYGNFLAWK